MIPNPDLSNIPVSRTRTFQFGSPSSQPSVILPADSTGAGGDKGRGAYKGRCLDVERKLGSRFGLRRGDGAREVWTLQKGGYWDHPIHIHFEEGQILARNGSAANVAAWEKGRKDVYRLRPGGSVTLTMQFRDWGGMFMEHCHNTVHEDNAMLVRWEIDDGGAPFLRPLPTPLPGPTGVTFVAPDDIAPTAL